MTNEIPVTNHSDSRYSRLAAIDGFGHKGVKRLRNAGVLIIGCGALGSLSSMYLAASGIGKICICDFDTIDLSNLQRQLFFDETSLGMPKAEILKNRMNELNSTCDVIRIDKLVTRKEASRIFMDYDFIIDGSDNPFTKMMTASTCATLGKPYCTGGVRDMSGQVMSWTPGHTGYDEIFAQPEQTGCVLPCSTAGVLGPAAGIVASTQAAEAIKHISGCGDMLLDKLLIFDLKTNQWNILPVG
ncbi:MAG: HesA/MoeB/ThiF family protein [Candidatus Amulumruptor caecigallinarius]|nr:HesA/MoeB/ThiF family protein [Candidatus Amulumruptor caecigallinarius]